MQKKISIPEDIYDKLRDLAQTEFRSMSDELRYIINQYTSSPTPPQFIPHNTPGGIQIPDTPPIITADTTTPGTQPTPTPTRRTVIDFDPPGTQTTPYTPSLSDTPPALSTIEDYEQRLCNPDDEFYYRVKEYFLKHKQPERFLTLLQLVNSNPPTPLAQIKEDYIMSIYDALNTPVGYDLTTHEWKDLLSSFKIK